MKETPLELEGINDNIYAGFGPRLASLLLDAVIIMPLIFIIQYINSTSKYMFFYTLIPNLIFGLWYNIYLPKKHGGTPGKLIMGMQILNLNGKSIGWKEAFLRHVIILLLTLFSSILMIDALIAGPVRGVPWSSWLQIFTALTVKTCSIQGAFSQLSARFTLPCVVPALMFQAW